MSKFTFTGTTKSGETVEVSLIHALDLSARDFREAEKQPKGAYMFFLVEKATETPEEFEKALDLKARDWHRMTNAWNDAETLED